MSRLNSNFELIKALENELKKLSPQLSISSKGGDPLNQIVDIVRFSIEALLSEKRNLEQESIKLIRSGTERVQSDSFDTTNSKKRLVIAQKELERYQQLLIEKEKSLQIREAELDTAAYEFTEERKISQVEASIIEGKAHELEIRIMALRDKESQLKNMTDTFEIERRKIEDEKNTILKIKQKIEENCMESEKIREINLITQENLQRDIKLFEVEKQILEEKVQAQALKQDYIEKSQEDLERKKRQIDEERNKISREREYLQNLKQEISDQKISLQEDLQESEKTKRLIEGTLSELKSKPTASNFTETKDIVGIYAKLQGQIEIYNSEVNIREAKIADQQDRLRKDRERLNYSIDAIGQIQNRLIATKNEILAFRNEILYEFESLFTKSSGMCTSLSKKLPLIDELYSRMNQNLYIFSSATDTGVSPEEFKVKRFEGKTNGYQLEGTLDSRVIEEMMIELENKLRMLEEKQIEIETEAIGNATTAENLRLAKEKLDSAKTELEEKEERFKVQHYNLTVGVRALTNKENELMNYRLELDKRTNLLNIKEQQLNLRVLQARDKGLNLSDA